MKNQYFGDINDYKKYGILRLLSDKGRAKIGVCWMLTGDGRRTDGMRVGYLHKSERWRSFDTPLFDALKNAVVERERRDVSYVQRKNLIPRATYYSRRLTDGNREEFFTEFEKVSDGLDLIFFDPDNGMEVRSVLMGARGSHKYLYWIELTRSFSRGHSLLVYQHFPRIERKKFTTLMLKTLHRKTGVKTIYSLRAGSVVFFLLPQRRHAKIFGNAAKQIQRKWENEIILHKHSLTP